MLQHRKHIILLAGLAMMAGILVACRPTELAPAAGGQPPATPGGDLVTITLSKQGDKSTLGEKDGTLWIEIESPSGIGSADVTWTVTPTTPVMLRLHLGGLEELSLVNGDAATSVSVSSSTPHIVTQSTRDKPGDQPQQIAEGDPAWLNVSWSDDYFDVDLSDPRLTQPGTPLEIRWIDFYR
jgi:hypothetical protein